MKLKTKKLIARLILIIVFGLSYTFACWFVPISNFPSSEWVKKILLHHLVLIAVLAFTFILIWVDLVLKSKE